MRYLAQKAITRFDEDNGNKGCSTSFSIYIFSALLPYSLVAVNNVSNAQYPPRLVLTIFLLQIAMMIILPSTIPNKTGMLDSAYLFILSFPFFINLLIACSVNLTTMYYGTHNVITWGDYLTMVLVSLFISTAIAYIIYLHIRRCMINIRDGNEYKKYWLKVLLWFVIIAVIILLISAAIQFIIPVKYMKVGYTNDTVNDFLGFEYILPSYGIITTIAALFFCGMTLLLIFISIQSKMKNPISQSLYEYIKHNEKNRKKLYTRSVPDNGIENEYAFKYLHQGKFPDNDMPKPENLKIFKFSYLILDDFTGELTHLDTIFIDCFANMLSYHPNLEFFASLQNYNHVYQTDMTDEDKSELFNILRSCNIYTWDKHSSIPAKSKIWSICLEYDDKSVFTISGGSSDRMAYEIEPDIQRLIQMLSDFRKRVCNNQ